MTDQGNYQTGLSERSEFRSAQFLTGTQGTRTGNRLAVLFFGSFSLDKQIK